MKLIEALIMAQQEFGADGHWKATHFGNVLYIERTLDGFYTAHDYGVSVLSRSDRLETVLADMASRYPAETLDDQWKISQW